jgi:hypothetical protein
MTYLQKMESILFSETLFSSRISDTFFTISTLAPHPLIRSTIAGERSCSQSLGGSMSKSILVSFPVWTSACLIRKAWALQLKASNPLISGPKKIEDDKPEMRKLVSMIETSTVALDCGMIGRDSGHIVETRI